MTLVILATPTVFTEPSNFTSHVIGNWKEDGDFTVSEPDAEKTLLTGAILTAFAIEAAPMQTAKADNDTRVFKLFIVFPHM